MIAIYKIKNIVNEKFYIGSAKNFQIRKKAHLYSLRNNKPVLQFDKQGNFIKEWISIREASNTLNIKHSCISNCCSGRHKTAGKFVWKLKNNN